MWSFGSIVAFAGQRPVELADPRGIVHRSVNVDGLCIKVLRHSFEHSPNELPFGCREVSAVEQVRPVATISLNRVRPAQA